MLYPFCSYFKLFPDLTYLLKTILREHRSYQYMGGVFHLEPVV
jgi:hypothetical protein